MPRLVDYAARWEFLREAAMEVVLAEGVDALSRRSIARVQGVAPSTIHRLIAKEADLVTVAAEWIISRRRRHRPAVGASQEEKATALLLSAIPDEEARVREELAWMHLVLWARRDVAGVRNSPEGTLRDRYQVALHGHVESAPAQAPPRVEPPPAELRRMLQDRRDEIDTVVRAVVRLLEVPEQHQEDAVEELLALTDGLTWAVCTGRTRPGTAHDVLRRGVGRWSSSPAVRSPPP